MKIELCSDGYEKIEEQIKAIENLANEGMFSLDDAPKYCQQIILKTKNLRQVLHKVLTLVPDRPAVPSGAGSAA